MDGRELRLVRTGATRAALRFVAVGTVIRCVLGPRYARYLVGKYRILPSGQQAVPFRWRRAALNQPGPQPSNDSMTALVYQEDAVSLLSSLPEGSVNLIITDPAYESLEKHRAKGTTTRLRVSDASSNAWFEIFKNERFPAFFEAAYKALATDAHFYIMCDQETAFAIKPMGEAAGFKFWKPIIWDKQRIGMGYHYRCQYEMILFFEKGKRRLNDLGIGDVLSFPRIKTSDAYPTEKPVDLLEVLVRQSSNEGDLVVDPFLGSGATGEAALRNKRLFIGGDTSEAAVARAKARLGVE